MLWKDDDAQLSSDSSRDSQSGEDSDSSEEVKPPAPKCFRHYALGNMAGKFVSHKVSKLVHYKDSLVSPKMKMRKQECCLAAGRSTPTM